MDGAESLRNPNGYYVGGANLVPTKFFTIKKTYPCGQLRANKLLQEVLQHYNTCEHDACKQRAKKFENFFAEESNHDAS